ncbi:hypothetical protein VU03_02320, partial [Desulfobulbus sp. N3]|nr:hypothetical protein [Desulfobulbus sp. N3]
LGFPVIQSTFKLYKSLLEHKDGRVVVVFFDITDDGLLLNYNYLPLQKYSETVTDPPKYKKDSARYCKVSYKNLDKNKSIDELSQWLFLSAS